MHRKIPASEWLSFRNEITYMYEPSIVIFLFHTNQVVSAIIFFVSCNSLMFHSLCRNDFLIQKHCTYFNTPQCLQGVYWNILAQWKMWPCDLLAVSQEELLSLKLDPRRWTKQAVWSSVVWLTFDSDKFAWSQSGVRNSSLNFTCKAETNSQSLSPVAVVCFTRSALLCTKSMEV